MVQQVIVGLIVAAMLLWLILILLRVARSGGCTCAENASCPHADHEHCRTRSRDEASGGAGQHESNDRDAGG